MKKLLFLFVLFVLPCAYSLDNVLYKGWVTAGEPFSVENNTFVANYIEETNATVIGLPEGISAVIYASSMNCTQEWLYTICQENQRFRIKGFDVPPNIRSNDVNVSLYLIINKTDAGLTINREEILKEMFLGDVLEIKLSLDKIGQPDIFNISFIDYFPDTEVNSLTNYCQENQNKIILNLPVFDKRLVCLYRVTPQKSGIINNSAVLSYSVLGKRVNKVTSSLLLVSDAPATAKINFSRNVKIQEPINITISLQNNKNAELKELTVYFPAAFIIINLSSDFTNGQNIAVVSPKNKTYFVIIKSPLSGNFSVNLSLVYTYNNHLNELKKTTIAEVLPILPSIDFLKKENLSVIRVSNTADFSFKNIKIFVAENYFELPLLESGRYKEFSFEETDNITIASLLFQSEFGQYYNESLSLVYSKNDTLKQNNSKESLNKNPMPAFNISKEAVLVVLIALFLPLAFIFIKSRPNKTKLDEEIEEIRNSASNGKNTEFLIRKK
jgi:hypothetical protein